MRGRSVYSRMPDPDPNELPAGPKERIDQLIDLLTRECGELTEPEKKLARAVVLGEECHLLPKKTQQGTTPQSPVTPANLRHSHAVRADVIRTLCVSRAAIDMVDRHGIRLFDATITGPLNLQGAVVPFDIWLVSCTFSRVINVLGAQLRTLSLQGSLIAGLEGDRLLAQGGIFLRSGFRSTARVILSGAHIGGHLDCSGGQFEGDQDGALLSISAVIDGSVYLNDGFEAKGVVLLHSSRIGGDLDCTAGLFVNDHGTAIGADGIRIAGQAFFREGFRTKGEVHLISAYVGGSLCCSGGCFQCENSDALCIQGICIKGAIQLVDATFLGEIDLTRSKIGYLVDDLVNGKWPQHIILESCEYDAIYSGAPLDASTRLAWLRNHDRTWAAYQPPNTPPDPGPYRWLAGVLRTQGHERDADAVLERLGWRRWWPLLRQRLSGDGWTRVSAVPLFVLSFLYGVIVGHGYARFRPLYWLVLFWVLGAAVFMANGGRYMQPTQGYVLRAWTQAEQPQPNGSPGWDGTPMDPSTIHAWASSRVGLQVGVVYDRSTRERQALTSQQLRWIASYPSFSPWVYSLDAFLPLVNFHQEDYWTPSSGWWAKDWYLPFHIASGWVIATLFAASFTKLARHD